MEKTQAKPAKHLGTRPDWRTLNRRPRAHWLNQKVAVLVTGTYDVEMAGHFILETENEMAKFIETEGVNARPHGQFGGVMFER